MRPKRTITGALALTFAIALTAAAAWLSTGVGGVTLTGKMALVIYATTETGSVGFVPIVLLVALAILATDRAIPAPQRRRDALGLLVVLTLSLPAVAFVVEAVVKPTFVQSRPSHVRMSEAGLIPDLEAFYGLDKSARRSWLAEQIPESGADSVATVLAVHRVVLAHWTHEAGSTFPSAHAVNAFIAATLFLAAAIAAPTGRRRALAVLLLTWAIAVSMSRVLLLVHRPLDVGVGAVFGAAVGGLLTLVWWRCTQSRSVRSRS